MTFSLTSKVALITGAASGIGRETARRFAAAGARVVLADINAAGLQAVADELGCPSHVTDVTDEDQVAAAVQQTVDRFGQLDCMVNNAGLVGVVGRLAETDRADWHATLSVLLDSVFYGIKHAARVMQPQGQGVILSISSIAGVQGGLGPHAYTAAKHAVIGLTRSAASELSASGIRVNAVAPGTTVTALVEGIRGGAEQALAGATQASPLGSALMPEEVASALLYLASDAAAHVTAHTLVIDSGITQAATSGVRLFHDREAGVLGGAPRARQ